MLRACRSYNSFINCAIILLHDKTTKIMSLDKIKQISFREYLDRIGAKPARENAHRGMYHSPLWNDMNVCFSIDYIHNI